MPRKATHHRLLPFRIPFFRIFYSTTYTVLYLITLILLAITPASLIYTATESSAYQYIFVIGGVYVLTALLAIFVYSSRLYTNRTVLAGVGKAYIPVEDGEVGKSVRKMIVRQLERSAIVAWESRPRDLMGEILTAETLGLLPAETGSLGRNDYTVGRIVPVDPAQPPWGHVRHPGWSSPSHGDEEKYPDVQFASVVQELPNLVEARAVSLAPADPDQGMANENGNGQGVADPVVVELLQRPETMGMRDYLTQLSYLGLVNPPEVGQAFLQQYEHARFCGLPTTESEFAKLMSTFSELLSGMTELDLAIIAQIRAQTTSKSPPPSEAETNSSTPSPAGGSARRYTTPSPARPYSPDSELLSPVTAREALSRTTTPYMQHEDPSMESFSSVIHNMPDQAAVEEGSARSGSSSLDSASMVSLASDAGSVLRHRTSDEEG